MGAEKLIYGKGVILRSGHYYLNLVLASREEKDVKNTIMLIFENGDWNFWEIDNRIVDYVIKANGNNIDFQGVTEDGFINTDSFGQVWDHIDRSDDGPNLLKHMTSLCSLDGYYYTVGMSRMVYRKKYKETNWTKFNSGIRTTSKNEEISGFISIDGFNSDEIYAVGYEGDLWLCDCGYWQEIESPTNVVLNSVIVSKDNNVYICGNDGVVLKGRRDKWVTLDNEVTENDLWSIEEFNKKIYISADMMPLYQIEDSGLEVVSECPIDTTSGSLNANDGEMLSVGENDIFIFDGSCWKELVVPPYA